MSLFKMMTLSCKSIVYQLKSLYLQHILNKTIGRLMVFFFFDMSFKAQVEALVQEALEENPSLFLIDFSVGGDNSIRILLDGDEGVSLEACMQVSRKVEHNLDREENDFSIEVSSCGIGSPLTMARQFKKNINRKLEVLDQEDKLVRGTLTEANDESFTLQWKAREPKPVGKGKVTVTKTKEFQYGMYKNAKVIVSI